MEERCVERNCNIAARVNTLEEQFKLFQERKNTDHHEIFSRLGELEQLAAVQEERDKTINDKLDKLIDWQEQQQGKPGRLQERLPEGALLAVVGGFVGYLLALAGIV